MPKTRAPARSPGPVASEATGLVYLYCVLEPGTPGHDALRNGRVTGLQPDRPLFPIEAAGLVAAVSRVPAEQFHEEALNALLADLSRLAPVAVHHEQAVRTLLPLAPALVPMVFGVVYQSPDRVEDLLRERARELRAILERVRGKQEWGLKVFGDLRALRQAAETASQELRRLAEEAIAAGPGRAYLLGKRRERLLAQETARFVADAVRAVLDRLAARSAEARQDDISAVESRGADAETGTPDQQLLAKAAFLVHAAESQAFQAQVDDLQRTCDPLGLSLELSGPWAPYSFVGTGRGAA